MLLERESKSAKWKDVEDVDKYEFDIGDNDRVIKIFREEASKGNECIKMRISVFH